MNVIVYINSINCLLFIALVSTNKMDKNFCISLPKLELHAHLNGSLSEKTLQELQTTQENISEFLKLNQVLELGPSRTLEECFEIFKIAHNATSTLENVQKATENVIKEFSDDGVIYLELRTTPRNGENMSKREYIEAVLNGIKNSKISCPKIRVKLILSLDRKQPISEAEENAELTIEYRKKYPEIIVAIDVSGDPTKGTWFENILQKVKTESDLKITIHCAEVKNEDEILEILQFKPDRIGHGSFIHPETGGSKQLWEKLLEQKIPLECCLTSNIKTKTTEKYENHHFKYLFSSKHPITLCTDDKGVFSTNLSDEFKITADKFKLSKMDLWRICVNTIDFTFCNELEKFELKNVLMKWFNENLYQETSV